MSSTIESIFLISSHSVTIVAEQLDRVDELQLLEVVLNLQPVAESLERQVIKQE